MQARFGITKRLGFIATSARWRSRGSPVVPRKRLTGSRLSRAEVGEAATQARTFADAIVMGACTLSEVKRSAIGALSLARGKRSWSSTMACDFVQAQATPGTTGAMGAREAGKGFRSTQEGCKKMLSPFFFKFLPPVTFARLGLSINIVEFQT